MKTRECLKLASAVCRNTLAVPALLIAGIASAADPVSDKFDGAYKGWAELVEPLSGSDCSPGRRYSVTIEKGHMHGVMESGTAQIGGIVTSDGFFTGRYRFEDGAYTPFEGSISENRLIGGVFRNDRCAWLLKLRRVGISKSISRTLGTVVRTN